VFAAGGSVLASLMPGGTEISKGSDIDLFLVGLKTEDEANNKLRQIFQQVQKNVGQELNVIRTHRAVTMLCPFPFRHVQVILRLYHSPTEVLLGFDIDCCCVGYNGKDVWGLERFRRALTKGYNLVYGERRSVSLVSRLVKYGKRGFCGLVPDLDKANVDVDIFKPYFPNVPRKELGSLGNLLLHEFYDINPQIQSRLRVTYTASLKRMLKAGSHWVKKMGRDSELADRLEEYVENEVNNPSDYSELYIPYGPKWESEQIMTMIKYRDRAQFFSDWHKHRAKNEVTPEKQPAEVVKQIGHKHLFVAGIEGAISGLGNMFWCRFCQKKLPLQPAQGETDASKFVEGPLKWFKEGCCYQDIDHEYRRPCLQATHL